MDETKCELRERPPRMMTVRQVAATGILPENCLRMGIRAGWVPHVKNGNRPLINYDKLLRLLEEC